MKYYVSVLVLVLCLCGCAGQPGGVATTAPDGQATTAADGQAPLVLTSGPLTVSVTSPADEAVVNTAQVEITGEAPPETVISIDDQIVVVGTSGQFSIQVPLQEGPNELEIVASDPDGNEASSKLVVTYDPSS